MVFILELMRDLWGYILLAALVGLSIYFIFRGSELVGTGILIISAFFDYRLKMLEKTCNKDSLL